MKYILLFALIGINTFNISAQQRLLGGDISMLTKYEQAGTVYRNSEGKKTDALKLFKKEGWNAMRLRLFVDSNQAPEENKDEGVCQDLDYVMKLGKRIKKAGFQLMLDFHYSDTWADPGKQFTPASWQGASAEALADSVYQYTKRSLIAMKKAGAEPELIQVGMKSVLACYGLPPRLFLRKTTTGRNSSPCSNKVAKLAESFVQRLKSSFIPSKLANGKTPRLSMTAWKLQN